MRDVLRFIGTLILVARVGWAQNPADISFTLNTKNGQTTFRQGEAIPVELHFQSATAGRYQVITDPSERAHLNGLRVYDRFTGEPAAYAVDPLREQTRILEALVGALPRLAPVTTSPVIVEQVVNDWISFRRVGHYRISAQTQRVSLVDRSQDLVKTLMPKPLPLQSNTIEIEVVAAEDGWADTQLQRAVALLSRETGSPGVGRTVDIRREQEIADAARVLRFLDTRDAALALVRFFEQGPERAQADLLAGLYGSPYRNEVISALKAGLSFPDAAVTSNWIDTIADLTTAQELGPCPLPEKDEVAIQAWLKRFRAEIDRNMEVLSGAVAGKQGQARAVSLEVLSRRNGAQPAPASAIASVLENFHELPANTQWRYLTQDWYRIASPTIVSLVRSLAEGTGPVRDVALIRLQELDPAGARPIVLNRIRKGDLSGSLDAYRDPRALLQLPDRVLPEMDQPLVDLLEQGKPVGTLVCRYVSDAMFGRLQAWVEAHPYSVCDPGNSILPYLFRVDPAYAADRLARTRSSRGPVACTLSGSPSEDPFLSPGLEKAAIADLANANPSIQRSALDLLTSGGSAAAEQPIWDGLARLREGGKTPGDEGLEYGYVNALTRGIGWIMTPEKLARLAAACITDSCRQNVEAMRRWPVEPVGISMSMIPNEINSVMIGHTQVRGVRQIEAKIRQFPRGTRFFFPTAYQGVWYYEQRLSEIRPILNAAGMLIVDQPPRN